MSKTYNLDVRGDVARLKNDITELTNTQVKAAARSASSSVIKTIAGEWLREVAARAQLKKEVLKNRITVVKASVRNPSVVAYFRTLPISFFKRKISDADALEAVSTVAPNAFIATMKNGKKGVFQRIGKKRLPIEELKIQIAHHVDAVRVRLFAAIPFLFEREFDLNIQKKIKKMGLD